MTFARACAHATNCTVAHESGLEGGALVYPDNHIEVDNRLAWHLGRLGELYPDAAWVHLSRDPGEVAASYAKRWNNARSMVRAYGEDIARFTRSPESARASAVALVETVEANIREFLRHRTHVDVRVDRFEDDFKNFWKAYGLAGDLKAALAELRVRYNQS